MGRSWHLILPCLQYSRPVSFQKSEEGDQVVCADETREKGEPVTWACKRTSSMDLPAAYARPNALQTSIAPRQ